MDRFYKWIAYNLPNRVVYWCVIRMWSSYGWKNAKRFSYYGNPNVRISTVINRWEKEKGGR